METLAFEYHIRAADGSTRRYRSDFGMRVSFPGEPELLFRATGFALERLRGSSDGEPYASRSPPLLSLGRVMYDALTRAQIQIRPSQAPQMIA